MRQNREKVFSIFRQIKRESWVEILFDLLCNEDTFVTIFYFKVAKILIDSISDDVTETVEMTNDIMPI